MSDVDFVTEPTGVQAKELAASRWKGLEGALYAPDLTPAQRMFLACLIAHMHPTKRECFPSETRVAVELGLNPVTITKIKWVLKSKGYIDWDLPYGPRGGCFYGFNWTKLHAIQEEADRRVRQALAARKKRKLHSPKAVKGNDSPRAVIKLFEKRNAARSFTAAQQSNHCHAESLHCPTGVPTTAVGQSDVTHDVAQGDVAQERHGDPADQPDTDSAYRKDILETIEVVFTDLSLDEIIAARSLRTWQLRMIGNALKEMDTDGARELISSMTMKG